MIKLSEVITPEFLEKIERVRLEPNSEYPIGNFDCNDSDLNEFLIDDAKNFASELLAVTNLYMYEGQVIAFYSVLNDKIAYKDFNLLSNRQHRKLLPYPKRHLEYLPAVKIGRLGVDKKFSGKNFGSIILDLLKMSFTHNNKTGCTFMTVDAYNKESTLNFYSKNGFVFFTEADEKEKTRSMYFDLRKFIAHKESSAS